MAGHVACWRGLGTAIASGVDQEETRLIPQNPGTESVRKALKGILKIGDPLSNRCL